LISQTPFKPNGTIIDKQEDQLQQKRNKKEQKQDKVR